MAIVQISRITQRKGLQEDLPQLAGAEFGWSTDQRRLFIGNGTLEEGAPVVGNTEILTEFSDILILSELYTYKGQAAGYTVQTGPSPGRPITQTLQSWMDQWASIKDFGAVGDGVTDDTAAINRALNQIYCREVNPQIRRSIFFPAGVYKISDTIVVPPYAALYGEGQNSSTISLTVTTWTNTIAYSDGTVVQSGGSYYRSIIDVPTGINVTNTDYWEATTMPEYVVRTGDSLQQIGANIGTNGAIPPTAIDVTGMGFSTTHPMDVLLIEDATECVFEQTDFRGSFVNADIESPTFDPTIAPDDTACVRFASTTALVSSQIKFYNCEFSGSAFGINTDQQVNSITVTTSNFNTLYQGVVLGAGTVVNGGPTGVRIVSCEFNNIYAEGIIFGDISLNISTQNVFYDVGNHFGGVTQPYTSIIDIQSLNNISVSDMFQRSATFSGSVNPPSSYPRIVLNNTASIAFTNAEQLALGTYVRETGQIATLPDNTSTTSLFTVDSAVTRAFSLNYTITRGTAYRTGVLTVTTSSSDSTGDLEYSDDYVENSNTGVTLTATENSDNTSVNYATTSTGTAASITYSITHLA